jgi:shikimate kinase
MNLVLIGYRGTGKSTIGKILAAELKLQYVSLDEEIVARAGQSISAMVEEYSWEYFRDLEEAVVKEYSRRSKQLLDTGGGVITRPQNVQRLRETGLLFLLTATIEDIIERIGADQGRPALTASKSFTEEIAEVLSERESLYQKAAHFVVDTSHFPVEDAVKVITQQYRESARHPHT